MTNAPGSNEAKVVEIIRPKYTWKRLQNLWTSDPTRAVYLDSKEQPDGSTWNSTYIGSCEHTDATSGVTTEHKFKLFGPAADNAKIELKDKNQTALIWAEGYIKQEHWEDGNGNQYTGSSTMVKSDNLAVIEIKPYSLRPVLVICDNPFSRAKHTDDLPEDPESENGPMFSSEQKHQEQTERDEPRSIVEQMQQEELAVEHGTKYDTDAPF